MTPLVARVFQPVAFKLVIAKNRGQAIAQPRDRWLQPASDLHAANHSASQEMGAQQQTCHPESEERAEGPDPKHCLLGPRGKGLEGGIFLREPLRPLRETLLCPEVQR
jgi:hypothetical protein